LALGKGIISVAGQKGNMKKTVDGNKNLNAMVHNLNSSFTPLEAPDEGIMGHGFM